MSPRRVGPDRDRSSTSDRLCGRCGGTGQILNPRRPTEVIACPSCGGVGRTGRSETGAGGARDEEVAAAQEAAGQRTLERQIRQTRNDAAAAADAAETTALAVADYLRERPDPQVATIVDQLRDITERLRNQHREWNSRASDGVLGAHGSDLVAATRDTAREGRLAAQRLTARLRAIDSRETAVNEVLRLLDYLRSALAKLVDMPFR